MVNHLVDAMCPLTSIRNLFGMAPLFLSKRIWVSYVKAFVVLLLYTVMFAYLLHQGYGVKLNYVTELAIYVKSISYYLITFVIVIAEYWNIKEMIAVLATIEEVDVDFTSNYDLFYVKIDYDSSRQILRNVIHAFIALITAVSSVYFYLIFNIVYVDVAYLIAILVTNILPPTIMGIMIVQYCFCLGIIRKRFERINHQLMEFDDRKTLHPDNIHVFSGGSWNIQLKKVQVSCGIYSKLVETCGLLNSAHNAQVVLFFASSFIVAVTQIYSVLTTDIEVSSQGIPDLYIGIAATWCHIFGIIIMSFNCHKVASEAARTGVLLHKMKNKANALIKEEVEIWSLQIMHEKVEFNACGFFVIDMTLVYSVRMIIGSVTTYLVILIQFSAAAKTNSAIKTNA